MEFRKIMKCDIDDALALFAELRSEDKEVSFTDVADRATIESWVDSDDSITYVALENGKLAAILKAKRSLEESKRHAVFLTIAVRAEFRGVSLAMKLTNYGLEDLPSHGVKIARIYVYSDNFASLKAVQKIGFVESGRVLMHHFNAKIGEYVDDIIYHKLI